MKLGFRRIAVRLFAYAFVQTWAMYFAAWASLAVYWHYSPPPSHEKMAEYLVAELAAVAGDDQRFEAVAQPMVSQLNAYVELVDAHGRVLSTRGTVNRPRRDEGCRSNKSDPATPVKGYICARRELAAASVLHAASVQVMLPRPAPSLWQWFAADAVILVVGAILVGRSLARPLRHMSQVAQEFGAGKLRARVNLSREDEIGDVAAAFDRMADRVTDLLRVEMELLANISHELRTPLTRIRLALEFAGDGDVAVARESRKDIADDLDELERIIADVLVSARLQLADGTNPLGISPLRLERVALADIVSRAVARFRSAHPTRPLVLDEVPLEHELNADPVQLRRAIDNLLANAHKYTEDPETPVAIGYEGDAHSVRLHIIDRGIGISEDDQRHLFTPFFRVDRSRSRATGGLGLGLVLVRRIVEAHRGTVRLESRLGQGTVATIELPRAPT